MEIVIDIPKRLWTKQLTADDYIEIVNAVANGTPLPEHHGRLIDADALVDSLDASDRDIYCKAVIEEDAPTIIEGSDSE